MPSWVCQWKPFWIPVGGSFKKTYLEEWIFTGDDSSDEQRVTDFPVLLHSTGNTDYIRDDHPPTPRPSRQPDSLPWEPTRPQDKAFFWERIEAPLPPLRPRCNFIYPRQPSPFPERLELQFSNDDILCGYEVSVSSRTDHFTAWVKMNPHEVLVQHMVDVQRATADFREASERRPATSSQTNRVSKHYATRSIVQKRLSVYNWNPGPRRGKEDALEKQIAGKWHIITLQEKTACVDRDILISRFHVTHYAVCAILFNKDTFYPNKTRLARSSHGRGTGMGHARCSFTRLISSNRSQWSKVLYCIVPTYRQHLRQEERLRQEAHPHHSCYHDFSTG